MSWKAILFLMIIIVVINGASHGVCGCDHDMKVVQSHEITIKVKSVLAARHSARCSVVLYCHRARSLGKALRCRPKGRAAPSRPLSMHLGPMCRTIPI